MKLARLNLLLVGTPGILHFHITQHLVWKYGADALKCMISVTGVQISTMEHYC
jgi:hypothetical protein